MKVLLMVITSLTFSLICFGQEGKITLTLNPFSFLEPEAGFTPGIGYNLNERWAIYSDVGVIFFEGYPNNKNNEQTITGYKIKPAVRYYLNNSKKNKGSFWEIEGLLKRTNTFRTAPLPISDNAGNRIYRYLGGWNIIRTIYGASIISGYRISLSKDDRFGADTYLGLGFRTGNEKNEGLPPGAPNGPNGVKFGAYNERFFPGGIAPSFPGGVKFFYNL